MRLAWLRWSDNTTSSQPTTAVSRPRLAAYPEPNRSAASVPLNAASRSSSSVNASRWPVSSREPPDPTPRLMTASQVRSTRCGWAASPR